MVPLAFFFFFQSLAFINDSYDNVLLVELKLTGALS